MRSLGCFPHGVQGGGFGGLQHRQPQGELEWTLALAAREDLQPKVIYGTNMGRGTTVYQGDNRFSLRDIEFYQHKVGCARRAIGCPRLSYQRGRREFLRHLCDGFTRAGQLAERLQWSKIYYSYWLDSIAFKSRLTRSWKSSDAALWIVPLTSSRWCLWPDM